MQDKIAVIIATSFNRTELLIKRALKSVYKQTNINPCLIYIVDDNTENQSQKIKQSIKKLRQKFLLPRFKSLGLDMDFRNFFHTEVIKNTRTKGFSGTGAWNSAAFKAMQNKNKPRFLAFLDDDDEWESDYLSLMLKSTQNKKAQTILSIAGILRIEKNATHKILINKKTFNKNEFFIKNPGLQGSNLFVDLKVFWAIGGFDESLKSATDRDIGIRLVDYLAHNTEKNVAFVNKILVKHYANSDKRVTTDKSAKKQGLDNFYRKYLHCFCKNLQEKSLKRASRLFDYDNFKINTQNGDVFCQILPPSGKTQPNTTKHNQTQPNTTKHNQTQPNTTKHNQTQPNTTKHNQTQPNTTKHNQTQPNTTY